jgi:hypothetical protein
MSVGELHDRANAEDVKNLKRGHSPDDPET